MNEHTRVMGLSKLLASIAARVESGVGNLDKEFLSDCSAKTAQLEIIAEIAATMIAGSGHAKAPSRMIVDLNELMKLKSALQKAGYLV